MKLASNILTFLFLLFAVVLLASGYLGAALAVGWVLRKLFPFDLFQGTLLALVTLGSAAFAVFRIGNALSVHDQPVTDDEVDDDEDSEFGDEEDDEVEDGAGEIQSSSSRGPVVRKVVAFLETDRGAPRSFTSGQRKRRKDKRRH